MKARIGLFVAIFALAAAQSAWADEIVDLNNASVTKTASEFSAYKDKIIQNGMITMSGGHVSGATAGKYTIGSGATVKDDTSGGPEFTGDWNFNVVDGGFYHQNVSSGDHRFIMPMNYGNCTFTLDNGAFTTDADNSSNNAEPLTLGWIWARNINDGLDKDVSMIAVIRNGSTLSVPNGNIRIGGARKDANKRSNTLKVDFAVTNSIITVGNEIGVGCAQSVSTWLNDPNNSYTRVTFGPGADITCKKLYARPNPSPSVTFDGATIRYAGTGSDSFIGRDSALGDVYTIQSNGLTIDIPSDKSLTCDANASSLKGEGGITKIGAGSITWNQVSSGGSAGMTFTGPLVVSNGTWTSTLDYAASAFKANGGTLALSGSLTAENVALEATDGGTLTLSSAKITDTTPSLTLAGGGKTDYFTRDGAFGTYELDSLTLGEGAVLDLDGNATAIDTINATTTNITATSANPATININFTAVPAAGTTFTLIETDSVDKFTVNTKVGSDLISNNVVVEDGKLKLTIGDVYTWGANQTNWGDTEAWTKGGNAATWSDGGIALFSTDGAQANLAVDAEAAKVNFLQNATVSGSGTLTVPSVSVDPSVSATISAPTAGALTKTGAGTLTLGASRTDQTILTEGTLAFSGTASLDWSKFTFGTDAEKAVTLEFGENATLAGISGAWNIGNVADRTVTVRKTGGDWTLSNDLVVGATSGATATFTQIGGTLTVPSDKWTKSNGGAGTINLNGGTLITKHIRDDKGSLAVNFNGGTLKANATDSNGLLYNKNNNLTVTVNVAGGTIDNDGKNITINADLLGTGDITFVGSGKTTIGGSQTGTGALNVNAGTVAVDGGVTMARPTTVANGATFTVNATSQATVNTLTLEAGSTLNIASYAGSAAALSVTTLTLPDSGTVALTLNGGAFPVGTYKILDKAGIAVADVEGKLVPSAGSETAVYSIDGSTLVLTVGTPVHGRWRSAAGNGNFSDPGNWEDGQVPGAGDALDFSGVTSGITINCGDLSATSFTGVTLPTAKVQVTINGTLRLASMSVVADSKNFSVASGSKLIVDGDVTLNSEENKGIRYIVFENKGMVEIGGKVITSGKPMGYPCYKCSGSATIAVKGIVSDSSGDHFKLNAFTADTKTSKWIVGRDGLSNESGKKEFWLDNNISAGAELKAAEDFAINSKIGARTKLTLDTNDGKTITINGEIFREHGVDNTLTVKGAGKVVCNYEQTESQKFDGNVVVTNTATLAINAGKWVTTGTIIVNTNATLQVAQSGTVALGGNLTLKAGAQLGFNYTNRNAPKLDLTDKTVTFDEGPTTNVVVKISATAGKRGFSGNNVLTAGGKFAGVKVTLASGAPDWALGVDVVNGEIVLDVKRMPTLIIVR